MVVDQMVLMEDRDLMEVVVVEWVVVKRIQVLIYKLQTGIESNFDHLRKSFMYLILQLKEGKYLIRILVSKYKIKYFVDLMKKLTNTEQVKI